VVYLREPWDKAYAALVSPAENAFRPHGVNPEKSRALSRITNAGYGTVGSPP
jgi:hypothetical protein